MTDWIAGCKQQFEKVLRKALPEADSQLHQAMCYSTLNGGKRLRPLLIYATAFIISPCRFRYITSLNITP